MRLVRDDEFVRELPGLSEVHFRTRVLARRCSEAFRKQSNRANRTLVEGRPSVAEAGDLIRHGVLISQKKFARHETRIARLGWIKCRIGVCLEREKIEHVHRARNMNAGSRTCFDRDTWTETEDAPAVEQHNE